MIIFSVLVSLIALFITSIVSVILSGILWDEIKYQTNERGFTEKFIYGALALVVRFINKDEQNALVEEVSGEIEYLLIDNKYREALSMTLSLLPNIHSFIRVGRIVRKIPQAKNLDSYCMNDESENFKNYIKIMSENDLKHAQKYVKLIQFYEMQGKSLENTEENKFI